MSMRESFGKLVQKHGSTRWSALRFVGMGVVKLESVKNRGC